MLEVTRPREGVVLPIALLLDLVLEVENITAVAVPANALAIVGFSFLLGVEERLHALIERRVGLEQVDDVELVVDAFAHVAHPEVEPLLIGGRVIVTPQPQVVLEVAYLLGTAQVA